MPWKKGFPSTILGFRSYYVVYFPLSLLSIEYILGARCNITKPGKWLDPRIRPIFGQIVLLFHTKDLTPF